MRFKILTLAAALSVGVLLAAGAALAQTPLDLPLREKNDLGKDQERIATAGLGFLKIGMSARAAGMADAFTSIADDASAAFWNPAGLAHTESVAWSTTYSRWLVGTQIFAGAVAYNTGTSKGGVLGLSLVYFKPESVEETTIYQPGGTGRTIDSIDMSVGLIYALKFTDKFAFGAKVDWVHEVILDNTLNTVKLDVGTLFHTGFRNLRLAMSLKNLGRNERYEQVPFWMPLNYYMAISDEIYGAQDDPTHLTVAFESAYMVDYDQRYHIGAELVLAGIASLRAGYKFNYDAERYSLGGGLKYEVAEGREIQLDIAYTDFGRLLNAPVRFTLGGTF